ncbi:hypothetical protein GGQ88_000857 [Novosphingobium hassiacum]|uniref:Uncharacterized protein n=1 Tax=Novosphingobium hassiacum TaxID=173676 RepID=A0A7W5ZUD4_9SPHN|nr:hypothetical protein [Novosphingobium hassiacum]MBB3859617.1 hypothetical protein [Novosphingobium hassiacum]
MEGVYLAVRHSFNHADTIIAYAVVIEWDDTAAVLSFVTRDDFTGPALQQGRVSFSTRTGHSYLLTNDFGRFELTVLGRPIEDGRLLGLCTTAFMHQRRPTPASSAIALMPVSLHVEDLPTCGPVNVGGAAFADYSEWLRSAERDGFARVVGSSLPQLLNSAGN